MFDRRGWLACGLLALIGVALPTMTDAATGKNDKSGKVEGTLTSITSNGVVIKKSSGTLVSLTVTLATKVELNGVRVPLTSLPLNSPAQALYDPATLIASKVEVKR